MYAMSKTKLESDTYLPKWN